MKTYIGIDISVNSTSISSIKGNEVKYGCVFNLTQLSKSLSKSGGDIIDGSPLMKKIDSMKPLVDMLYFRIMPLSKKDKKKDINIWHKKLMIRSLTISDAIVDIVRNMIDTDDYVIGIEHYSYGSSSDTMIQLVELGGYIKSKLIIAGFSNIKVFPAPRIRKHFGKGNYDKYELYKLFKKINKYTDSLMDIIHSLDESTYIKSKKDHLNNVTYNVKSPVNDMIDAYLIAEYCKQLNL